MRQPIIPIRRTMATAVALVLALTICHAQSKPEIFLPNPGSYFRAMAISDNGRYVVSQDAGSQDVDNPQPKGGKILDLSTNTIKAIPAPNDLAGVNDVADDGTVAGHASGYPGYYTPATGQWTTFTPTSGHDCGAFLAITPDARYAAGYFGRSSDPLYASPMLYDLDAGKQVALTNLPQVDMAGDASNQIVFYGLTPDGKYLLGQMSQSYLQPAGLFTFIYDVENQSWTPIGYDYDSATKKFTPQAANLHFIDNQAMSPNGQWVTGNAYIVNGGGDSLGGSEYRVPYRYHVPTGTFELYDTAADRDIGGNAITNDGDILGSTPIGNPYPTAMVRSGNFFISLDMMLSQIYGMTLNGSAAQGVSGAFQAISADGLLSAMVTYDNCYLIRMPEPFASAAAKVDLLANYNVSLPSGSRINRLGELVLTFDREVACKNLPSTVKLLRADGTEVRGATTTEISAANAHQMVVTFRTQTLDPGETYTVRIPAGYIWLKADPNVKSKEISLTYTGRNADAVRPISVRPADGSVLSELNYTSEYIAVTFDAQVKISPDAQCSLYNADDDTLLASLSASAQDNLAFFFPDGSFKLYYGSNYRVEIAQGSVTDLSGSGGCDAMTLNYKGAYVRTASDDDLYIFKSDCNDYSGFIFWANETLAPGAIPASWGFEADIPWLLVGDNEMDADMALAAHSMFAGSGTSDDWLMTPQLYIPDERASLQFDAQSFLSTKVDVLKVYVYESDMIYNYLNQSITDDIRAHADLVFDQQLSPGADDQTLSGDWTRYNVSLAKYAGKNIYIAFVNNNTDQSAIFLDNICVSRELDFIITNTTPSVVVAQEAVNVQGIITPAADNVVYSNVSLTLLNASGDAVDSITYSGEVSTANPYTFQFAAPLPLTVGETNTYSIEVKLDDKASTLVYTVKDLVFRPEKRVVLEEYTGSSCANCPLGILAIENLENIYPDNFIPVTIRTYGDDTYGTGLGAYSMFLGLDNVGAPSGRINRGDVLSPMLNNAGRYEFYGKGIITSDGNEAYLWADAVHDELSESAELGLGISSDYDETTRSLNVAVTVTSAINVADRPVNLFAVVVEDNLPVRQSNGFSTITAPGLGEWGAGGAYGSTQVMHLAKDVTRVVLNGNAFNGTPMESTTFAAGVPCTETLRASIPSGRLRNVANCRVVVMAIDGNTHKVINAVQAPFGASGIGSAEAADVKFAIDGTTATAVAEGQISLRAFTPSGIMLGAATSHSVASLSLDGYRGMVILSATTATGTATKRVMVK